jgi:hypothetical protein
VRTTRDTWRVERDPSNMGKTLHLLSVRPRTLRLTVNLNVE